MYKISVNNTKPPETYALYKLASRKGIFKNIKNFINQHSALISLAGKGAVSGGILGGTAGIVLALLKALGKRLGNLPDQNITPLLWSGLLTGGFIGAGIGGVAGYHKPTVDKLIGYSRLIEPMIGKIKEYLRDITPMIGRVKLYLRLIRPMIRKVKHYLSLLAPVIQDVKKYNQTIKNITTLWGLLD